MVRVHRQARPSPFWGDVEVHCAPSLLSLLGNLDHIHSLLPGGFGLFCQGTPALSAARDRFSARTPCFFRATIRNDRTQPPCCCSISLSGGRSGHLGDHRSFWSEAADHCVYVSSDCLN